MNGEPLELPEGETLGETLDLSGRTGRLEVVVRYGSRRPASSAGVTAVRRMKIHYVAHDGHREHGDRGAPVRGTGRRPTRRCRS